MNKFQYDKKQLPQVIVLAVISLGLFGYFGIKLAGPQVSAAAPQNASNQSASQSASQGASSPASASAPTQIALLDQPPGPGMRDPFIVPAQPSAPADPATTPGAPAPGSVKPIAPLPTMGSLLPLNPPPPPALPATFKPVTSIQTPAKPVDQTPGWSYAGMIGSDDDPGSKVAVLRCGDDHRYVRVGGWVDGDVKVVAIKSTAVVLCKDGKNYTIKMGATHAVDPAPPPAPAAPAITTQGDAAVNPITVQTVPAKSKDKDNDDLGL